jgi:hypothetical protein
LRFSSSSTVTDGGDGVMRGEREAASCGAYDEPRVPLEERVRVAFEMVEAGPCLDRHNMSYFSALFLALAYS